MFMKWFYPWVYATVYHEKVVQAKGPLAGAFLQLTECEALAGSFKRRVFGMAPFLGS